MTYSLGYNNVVLFNYNECIIYHLTISCLFLSAKTQYRGIIEKNVNEGLYDMDYIMDNQLYLPGKYCFESRFCSKIS